MEERKHSVLPCLPALEPSSLQWPVKLQYVLKSVARGPHTSKVDCGEELCECISDMRDLLRLPPLSSYSAKGFCLFFDDLITRDQAHNFYHSLLPFLANLALRMPILLKMHLQQPNPIQNSVHLRILHSQQPGLVLLTQEFVAALLACAFFCIYPSKSRQAIGLQYMNFDRFFGGISENGITRRQEQKALCIMHYFDRLCKDIPQGTISYERKVLLHSGFPSEPDISFWSKSQVALCPFKVFEKGLIEDEVLDSLEVDFANKFLGGGVLFNGCVQEEIRFCINPELIAGMVFLPAMEGNEAIEIVGAERFSRYEGHSSTFSFSGDYNDVKPRDLWGRRQTRIVAIDALERPGENQFGEQMILRETNKAFCGFMDQAEFYGYFHAMDEALKIMHLYKDSDICTDSPDSSEKHAKLVDDHNIEMLKDEDDKNIYTDVEVQVGCSKSYAKVTSAPEETFVYSAEIRIPYLRQKLGIATGNWGCGAFGGDFELKSLVQWIAASQAGCPFTHYYTFGDSKTRKLEQLAEWILKEGWHVGDCWSMMVDFGGRRINKQVIQGFFEWILPESGNL